MTTLGRVVSIALAVGLWAPLPVAMAAAQTTPLIARAPVASGRTADYWAIIRQAERINKRLSEREAVTVAEASSALEPIRTALQSWAKKYHAQLHLQEVRHSFKPGDDPSASKVVVTKNKWRDGQDVRCDGTITRDGVVCKLSGFRTSYDSSGWFYVCIYACPDPKDPEPGTKTP